MDFSTSSTVAPLRHAAFLSYTSRHVEELVSSSSALLSWLTETLRCSTEGPLLAALELLSRFAWIAAKEPLADSMPSVFGHLGHTSKHVRIFASRVVASLVAAEHRDTGTTTWSADVVAAFSMEPDYNMKEGLLLSCLELATRDSTLVDKQSITTVVSDVLRSRNDPLRLVALLLAEVMVLDVDVDLDSIGFQPCRVVATRFLASSMSRRSDDAGIKRLLNRIAGEDVLVEAALAVLPPSATTSSLLEPILSLDWASRKPGVVVKLLTHAAIAHFPVESQNLLPMLAKFEKHPEIPFLVLRLLLQAPSVEWDLVSRLLCHYGRQDATPQAKRQVLDVLDTRDIGCVDVVLLVTCMLSDESVSIRHRASRILADFLLRRLPTENNIRGLIPQTGLNPALLPPLVFEACTVLFPSTADEALKRFATGASSWRCAAWNVAAPARLADNVWGWASAETGNDTVHSHLFGPEPANLLHDDLALSLMALHHVKTHVSIMLVSPEELQQACTQFSLAATSLSKLGGGAARSSGSRIGAYTFAETVFPRVALQLAILQKNGEDTTPWLRVLAEPEHPLLRDNFM